MADYDQVYDSWQDEVSGLKSKWLLVSFSPSSATVPSTFMFTLIRRINNRLDAPCGHKLLKFFADSGIIVATGSACG